MAYYHSHPQDMSASPSQPGFQFDLSPGLETPAQGSWDHYPPHPYYQQYPQQPMYYKYPSYAAKHKPESSPWSFGASDPEIYVPPGHWAKPHQPQYQHQHHPYNSAQLHSDPVMAPGAVPPPPPPPLTYPQLQLPPARPFNELGKLQRRTYHVNLPSPNGPFDDSSGSDFISNKSSPDDFMISEPSSYFPNDSYNGSNSSNSNTTNASSASNGASQQEGFVMYEDSAQPASPVKGGLPSPPTSVHKFPAARGRSRSANGPAESPASASAPALKAAPAPEQPTPTLAAAPASAPSAQRANSPDGVQLDCNGRKPRQWRNRKYKCSHCSLVFFDRDLALYAAHIEKVEQMHKSSRSSSSTTGQPSANSKKSDSGSGRKFKCPEASCPWSRIGFVRKLEQQKHFTRKHGNPSFECRFWSPDGREKFPGCRACTTHWHADSGNRLRHERAVHGAVWKEVFEAQAKMYEEKKNAEATTSS